MLLLSLFSLPGCAGEKSPQEWLESCRRAVEEHAQAGGFLRFSQESDAEIALEAGTLSYRLLVEGEIVLPERERYDLREELESSIRPGEVESNAFTYLSVDGGKTAFVTGKGLAEKLGVEGWVHYTPPAGQNRHFDYLKMMRMVTQMGRSPQLLDFQEVEGSRCAHLEVVLEGKEIAETVLREDPNLARRLRGVDLGSLIGDMRMEIWVAEEDSLPRQLRMEKRTEDTEGLSKVNTLRFLFRDYLRQPPVEISEPDDFTEAG